MYIVVLEYEGKKPIAYIADWAGDPGRTLVKDLAKSYKTASAAKRAITMARKYRDFPDAKIILEDYCNAY
jgi:hypothetical protein